MRRSRGVNFPTHDLALGEVEHLRAGGVSADMMPGRLGMSHAAFDKMLWDAKRRGDPRAQWYQGASNAYQDERRAAKR